jgi:starch synthase
MNFGTVAGNSHTTRVIGTKAKRRTHRLRVIFVSAECAPFAQTGGLGEVVADLARALAFAGHDVRIALPWYRFVDVSGVGLIEGGQLSVPFDGQVERVVIGRSDAIGVPVYLLRHSRYTARMYRGRGDRYGWYDEPLRFRFFDLAVAMLIRAFPWHPDVVHLYDHHTGLVPAFLGPKRPAVVLSIQNAHFQGGFHDPTIVPPSLRDRDDGPLPTVRCLRARFTNFLRRGIRDADFVVAASKTYARELRACGSQDQLNDLLGNHRLVGILNGIDIERFDPARDPRLPAHYDATTLERRARNKRQLQRLLGFPLSTHRPLLAVIARLDPQKGIDIVLERLEELAGLGVQLAFMGDGDMRPLLERLSQAAPGLISYQPFDRDLETLYYAGADILLVPSRYEPCGLVQLKALRYGAVPVVHRVGGLADTVREEDPITRRGTGFTYVGNDPDALISAIRRALDAMPRSHEWRALQKRGMSTARGWDTAALDYLRVYRRAIARSHMRQS